MPLVRSSLAQAALVAAVTGVLFAQGLEVSPPHLTHDEIKFALQAKSVADTGRDINGRLLPLYFVEPGFSVGRDPLCIYVTAGVLRAFPLAEWSMRLATVIVAAVSVGLLYLLAAAAFSSRLVALIVAGIMALSPTFFIHGRLALSVIYPVPFTILWLILLRRYLARPSGFQAIALGVTLGAGVYSYLAAAIMMPLYMAVTGAVLIRRGDRAGLTRAVIAFAVMLVPLALWQAVEPERYANIVSAYRLFDSQPGIEPPPVQTDERGAVSRRVDTFWAALDPGSMFFTGESSLQISTREVGSVLTPVAVLLVLGLFALRHRTDVVPNWVWLFGLLTAPLPAVIMADVEIRRWLNVLPFIAFIAGIGAEQLLRGTKLQRATLALLAALAVAQFGLFTRDYFGPYRERSSPWFGGNIRAALTAVIGDAHGDKPSIVYISREIPWVEAYWRFYLLVAAQPDLLARTEYVRVQPDDVPLAQPGAVLVSHAPSDVQVTALRSAGWQDIHVVPDIDGSPSLAIVRPSP
jgi:4-amino-4-deoxy-L-arabinose transferase-like glycosyltransferase